jgi:type IV pilus assembly protein PilQ
LATLNGHEASLSNGEKRYYKEEKSNFIGTQNPTLSSSYTWTQITADLKITIKPFVSGNDQITLDIVVDQSQFTKSETVGAPPGSVTRNFKSLIRMKNQEMVLLGGLDNFSSTNTSQGLPLLARIPIIKWLFGSTSRSKTDTKLNLFIQPTIIY